MELRRTAAIVAAATVMTMTTLATPANADEPRRECVSNQDDGEVCIHIWGQAGQPGTIGVSFRNSPYSVIEGGTIYWKTDGGLERFMIGKKLLFGEEIKGSVRGTLEPKCYIGGFATTFPEVPVVPRLETPPVCL